MWLVWERTGTSRFFAGETSSKGLLGRLGRKWNDNILKELQIKQCG
jgi:hypothetical protein